MNVVPWPERALMRQLHRRGASHRRIAHAFRRPRGTVHSICRGIDRPRRYRTDHETRLIAKLRRMRLGLEGLCINGRSHGKATHGVCCKPCRETHRASA